MATHRIRKGETLSGIAARYKTSVSELARANKIANPNLIIAGKSLRVPGHDGPPRCASSRARAARRR